ncbi:MAG: PorV/PorQ family protein [Elusimicrobiota bacterium]
MAFAAALLAAARAQAAPGAGTSVAPLLQLGVGARPAGMGDNFVGLADDVHASAWNPAGLAFVPEKSVSFMYLNLYNLINYNALSYAAPLGERGGWGGHILYAYTDPIAQTTEDAGGNFNPAGGGTFRNSDLKANLSGGYALTPTLSVGAGGSLFQDSVGNDTVTGLLLDFGAFYKPHPLFTASASFQNIGPRVADADNTPALARFGGAFRSPGLPLVSVESDYSFDTGRLACGLGSEYWIADVMAVRAGFQLGDSANSGGNHYSVGVGFKFRRAQFDYAFSPLGVLGQAHRVALTFKFGDARGSEAPAAETPREIPRAAAPPQVAPEPAAPSATALTIETPPAALPEISTADAPSQAAPPPQADPFVLVDKMIAKKQLKEARAALTGLADSLAGSDQLLVRYHQRMGMILYRQGHAGEAQEEFSESLRTALKSGISDSAVASAYAGMGFCLVKKGDKTMARKFFAKGLESSPDERTRGLLEAQIKKLDEQPPAADGAEIDKN